MGELAQASDGERFPKKWPRALSVLGGIVFVCAVVAIWGPALNTPFLLDDYLHRSMLAGTYPAPRSPWNLYDFVDDSVRQALFEKGLLPWWTDPTLTIRFFRPLGSLLVWADQRLFGDNPWPMHGHSILWWIFAVLAARALFRATLAKRAARIATILFALSPVHAMPLSWLANREVLLALTFGSLGLRELLRYQASQSLRAAALASVLFALALLGGGEYAMAFGGYVFALALFRRDARWPRRVFDLWVFALPAATFLVVRAVLGYGAIGSGFYADPIHDLPRFLSAAPYHFVALMGSAWLTLDPRGIEPGDGRTVFLAMILGALALGFRALRRAVLDIPGERRAHLPWLLVGSLLSMLPTLAVSPSPRVMGIAALGVSAAVALVLEEEWFQRPASAPALGLREVVVLLLGFAHFIHGPVTAGMATRRVRADAVKFAADIAWLREGLGGSRESEFGVARGFAAPFFAPFALFPDGGSPARTVTLASTGHVLVLRKSLSVLEVRTPKDQGLYSMGESNLFRSVSRPLKPGDILRVPGLTAEVLDVGEAGPNRVRFTFERDPDSLRWFSEGFNGWEAVTLPRPEFGKPMDP